MTPGFYDQLAPYYHLLFPDWEASSERQSRGLAHVLGEFGVEPGSAVLDAACGIGTQTLGLAHLGYKMTASDISPAAAMRARAEAHARRPSPISVACHMPSRDSPQSSPATTRFRICSRMRISEQPLLSVAAFSNPAESSSSPCATTPRSSGVPQIITHTAHERPALRRIPPNRYGGGMAISTISLSA